MNHFLSLYHIAIQRHNDDLKQAAQARLRRIVQARHNSDYMVEEALVTKASLTRTTLRKTAAILKRLAAGLLILGLAGWGFVIPVHAQSGQVIEVGCTNGVGDVSNLIIAIRIANLKPQEDTIELAENCVYTLTQKRLSSDNGLPLISDDLVIEGNGATIKRLTRSLIFFRLLTVENGTHLTLRNLTLQGGLILDGNGGAVQAGPGTTLSFTRLSL